MKKSVFLFSILFSAGTALAAGNSYQDRPLQEFLTAHSKLFSKKTIVIPADAEKILFQAGKIIPYFSQLEKNKNYCALFVQEKKAVERKIKIRTEFEVQTVTLAPNGHQVIVELKTKSNPMVLQCATGFDTNDGAHGAVSYREFTQLLSKFFNVKLNKSI